jgi:hypothetical protein
MRPLLYLAAILLALPQLLLAVAFAVFKLLTTGTLGSLVEKAFELLAMLFSWKGAVVIAAFVALVVLGFLRSLRWFGAGTLALLLGASAIFLAILLHSQMSLETVWIFIPGTVALVIAIRLIVLDPPAGAVESQPVGAGTTTAP